MSINSLIDSCVKCVQCGKGLGSCDCFIVCLCGWFREPGVCCKNPKCECYG